MALDYTDIKSGVYFKMNGEVYEAISSVYSKKSRQKGSNQVRMKNLATGSVVSKTLRTSDKIEDVFITKRSYIFVYARGDEIVVHPEGDKSTRETLKDITIENIDLLASGVKVTALFCDEKLLTMQLPIKVDLVITDAPPAVRGNTTQGGNKKVTTETGATITVPLFIGEGDVIRVNTETREYVERVSKN